MHKEDKGAGEWQVQQNGVQEEEAFEEPDQGEELCPGAETDSRWPTAAHQGQNILAPLPQYVDRGLLLHNKYTKQLLVGSCSLLSTLSFTICDYICRRKRQTR